MLVFGIAFAAVVAFAATVGAASKIAFPVVGVGGLQIPRFNRSNIF